MFGNQNKNTELKTPEITEETPQNPTDNIFKELSWDLDFWKQETPETNVKVKDKEYYLNLSYSILSVTNIILVIILIFSFVFIKVQNNSTYYSKTFLDPFCFVILWDLQEKNTWDYCSSISSLSIDYDTKTKELKNEISEKLSLVFEDLYTIENFTNSKEVAFLLDKKFNKLNVIDILNDFDKLKNDFSSWDKWLIDCKDIEISDDETISMNCNIYSSSWEFSDTNWWWIVWPTWDRNTSLVEWTSISLAASFLNFIDKNPKYNFQLLDKQKVFQTETVAWEWPYVKMTKVELKMKYNNLKTNLSL